MTGRSRTSLVALSLTDLLAPAVALATCTDPAAVATTRASAEMACPCAGATSHGAYVRCVGDVARAAGDLSSECRRAVVACAARSTCARPGFVACCRTNARGQTRCTRKSDATRCRPPSGGQACVGNAPSCCDACVAGGCAAQTTTTTTITTTTTLPPACGNDQIDPGEECDGTAGGICSQVGVECGPPLEEWACRCCLAPGTSIFVPGPVVIPCCQDGLCQMTGPPTQCACGCLPGGTLCASGQTLPCCAGTCTGGICQ